MTFPADRTIEDALAIADALVTLCDEDAILMGESPETRRRICRSVQVLAAEVRRLRNSTVAALGGRCRQHEQDLTVE